MEEEAIVLAESIPIGNPNHHKYDHSEVHLALLLGGKLQYTSRTKWFDLDRNDADLGNVVNTYAGVRFRVIV